MLDQTTPPFRTGDVAYTRASPGGYASAAAVPTDPAYGGSDAAFAVPSLGGEFQPGSGMVAPTSSPITKGADADGGAADIAAAPRIGTPTPPTPPAPVPLAAEVNGNWIVFTGDAQADGQVDVVFTPTVGAPSHVITFISDGDSDTTVAAKVQTRLRQALLNASLTSNGILILDSAGEVPTGGVFTVTIT
jgi:hypothetical protein